MIPNSAVFDSNILIDYSHGREEARAIIKSCALPLISMMTRIEFLAGFSPGERVRPDLFIQDNFTVVDPDNAICEHTITLRHQRRFKLPDAIIYATALSCDVRLVTRNTKDFDADDPVIYIPYS
jgi:predicted nucleic acid-binding protein